MRFLFVVCALNTRAQDVYKTPSGKKYHLAGCRMVENVSEKISVQQATRSGLEPCKICRPEVVTRQPAVPGKAQGQANTVQCKGHTKRGTRCQHMTRIANGYCFQHQPPG